MSCMICGHIKEKAVGLLEKPDTYVCVDCKKCCDHHEANQQLIKRLVGIALKAQSVSFYYRQDQQAKLKKAVDVLDEAILDNAAHNLVWRMDNLGFEEAFKRED